MILFEGGAYRGQKFWLFPVIFEPILERKSSVYAACLNIFASLIQVENFPTPRSEHALCTHSLWLDKDVTQLVRWAQQNVIYDLRDPPVQILQTKRCHNQHALLIHRRPNPSLLPLRHLPLELRTRPVTYQNHRRQDASSLQEMGTAAQEDTGTELQLPQAHPKMPKNIIINSLRFHNSHRQENHQGYLAWGSGTWPTWFLSLRGQTNHHLRSPHPMTKRQAKGRTKEHTRHG